MIYNIFKKRIVNFFGLLEAFVPAHFLQEGSYYLEEEQVWVWKKGNSLLYYDIGE